MKIAKSSGRWISAPLLMSAALAAFGSWYASAAALAGSLFIVFLHRDPDRSPQGEGMVSPADGRVVLASSERMAIFMGPYDVHVNRSPLNGTVRSTQYTKGSHFPAFLGISSKNQQNRIEIVTDQGDTLELFQIAGALARRIVCYVRPGDRVLRGERIGMIHFGSRVEVTIPKGYVRNAKVGDRVRAGETIVAVKSE